MSFENPSFENPFFEKPSLYNVYLNSGDIRIIIQLIEKYDYTDEEVSQIINIYEPYEDNRIPEVEHIGVLLSYFPNSFISQNTMNAVKNSFPDTYDYIQKIIQKKPFSYVLK
jgi:hypothetical protein